MKRILSALLLVCLVLSLAPFGQTLAAEPIKIGGMYNVTGGMSSIDAPGLNGMKLAAKQINEAGGLLGRPVEIVAIDGKTDQTAVTNAVSEMINVHKVVAIGGLNDSTYALAAGPIAQAAGIPFVTAGATLPTLPEQIGDYFFMTPFGDDAQAYAVAEFAVKDLGAKTCWMLVDQAYDFTTALAAFFKERFTALGGEIVLEDKYQSGDTDFSAQIARLKALSPQPDVLFVSAIPNEAGITTKQIREAGLTQPILSGDGFDTPLIAEVAGENADEVYYSTHAALDNPDPKVQNFVKAYKEEYGRAPENAFAALGYDMMMLIADAIKRAGSAEPKAIRDALAETKDFQGVTGVISYEPGKRVPKKSVTIIKVQDGVYSFVKEFTPGPAAPTGEPIKIGGMYNVTGGMSSIDAPGLNGMKLAAKQINEAGGLLGRPVEIVAIDGKTDQTAVTNAVSEMINVHKVVAIGGLNDSTYALAAGPIAQAAGIPFVTAGATLPTLPEQIGDYFFMTPFGDDAQAYAVAEFAVKDLGAKTCWMLVDQAYDFTTALAAFFKERFTALGGEIVLEDKYQSGDTDFSAQIARLKALSPQPDVLFVSAIPNEAGITTKQIREAGLTQPILSGDGFDTPLIAEVAGENADEVYYSTHAALDNPDPKVQNFVKAYKEEYGRAPENAFAALGYDMMMLIADAIKRAGSAEPKAIRDALAETKDFQGVTGVISYEPGKRVPKKSVTIIKVQDGVYSFVKEFTPE
ncbi:MAG: ABC transporter substrate-binding protein [Anaerolineae bacterium]|nr:ABC transporter substrate-binding protein [Anaerolineae bacterium]